MSVIELVFLSIGLAMDAFAVAACKGLSCQTLRLSQPLITGAYFGGFQAAMPLLGFFLGKSFQQYIQSVDHWIAFILLALIGANMLRESFSKNVEPAAPSFGPRTMLPMAVATSIDALAVGVSLSCLPGTNITLAIVLIGTITFLLSAAGVILGNAAGALLKAKAEFAGGVVLIFMGLKILLAH